MVTSIPDSPGERGENRMPHTHAAWFETNRLQHAIRRAVQQLPVDHRMRQAMSTREPTTEGVPLAEAGPHDILRQSRAELQSTLAAVSSLSSDTPGRTAALDVLREHETTETLLDRLVRVPGCGDIRDCFVQAWSGIAALSEHIANQLATQGMPVDPEDIAAQYTARLHRELRDFAAALGSDTPDPRRVEQMLRTLRGQLLGEGRHIELTRHVLKAMDAADVRSLRLDQLASLRCQKRLSGHEVLSEENADLEHGLLELVRANYGESDVAEIRRDLMDADWEWSFVTSRPARGTHREVLMFLGERRLRDPATLQSWRYTGWLNGSKKVLGLAEATIKTFCLSDAEADQVCAIALPKVATFSIVLSNGGMAYGSETCAIDDKQYCRLAVLNADERRRAAGTELTPELAARIEQWILETFPTEDARHARHVYPHPVNGQQVMVQLYHSKRESGDGTLAEAFAAAGFPYLTGAQRLGPKTLVMAQAENPMDPERFASWQRCMQSRLHPTVEPAPLRAKPPRTESATEQSA